LLPAINKGLLALPTGDRRPALHSPCPLVGVRVWIGNVDCGSAEQQAGSETAALRCPQGRAASSSCGSVSWRTGRAGSQTTPEPPGMGPLQPGSTCGVWRPSRMQHPRPADDNRAFTRRFAVPALFVLPFRHRSQRARCCEIGYPLSATQWPCRRPIRSTGLEDRGSRQGPHQTPVTPICAGRTSSATDALRSKNAAASRHRFAI
jgi:hypothetical protein